MKISALFVFLIGVLFWASPVITGIPAGPESFTSTVIGGMIAALAVLSTFNGASGARHLNVILGMILALSPAVMIFTNWNVTAIIVQPMVGLLTIGLSLLETCKVSDVDGGWKRAVFRRSDEKYGWN
ncbi:MAG: hypothetical protein V4692_00405 [Bdellovibrionota bacterium]